MAFTNGEKFLHGTNAQLSIEYLLSDCTSKGYLLSYVKAYRTGMAGYSNTEQFYSPFLLEFESGEKWAVFSTTSMRTDRIKGQQWDALNLKQVNNDITAAYLVYPDNLTEHESLEFQRQNIKYTQGFEYSAIDGICSQTHLYHIIENYALQGLSTGQVKDLQGRYFEDRVAITLSNKENLEIWSTGTPTLVGLYYPMFEAILSSFSLRYIPIEIKATTDKSVIKKLPSGGNPKTDIVVEVIYSETVRDIFTISCKRSNSSAVSVHQYTADAFADVLDAENDALRYYLHAFQNAGSIKGMDEDDVHGLTTALKPYHEKLALWVLGGIGGDGNPAIQWATHILAYDDQSDTMTIHSVDEYYDLLLRNNVSGNFGTCFSWTYPSKRRGQSIQLKSRIL